jgi:hypothetical protein
MKVEDRGRKSEIEDSRSAVSLSLAGSLANRCVTGSEFGVLEFSLQAAADRLKPELQ